MLLKLIKFEIKASYKLIVIAHIFLFLLAALISGFLLIPALQMDMSILVSTLLYTLTIFASLFGIQIYIAIRFYKNLFTDEGYLMHTLPTTPTALLHSKIITGLFWLGFNFIMIILSAGMIAVSGFMAVDISLFTMLNAYLSISPSYVLNVLFQLLLSGLASVLKIYGCICIGQLFNKNRVFASILAFFGLTLVTQFINLMVTFSGSTAISYSTTTTGATIMNFSSISAIITMVLFYVICRYIMKRRLNLV